LKFKGGKGIATSAGVLAALVPWSFLVIIFAFVVVCFITRYVSAGSLTAAVILPFATLAFYPSWPIVTVTILMSLLAIYRHKANIKRLMNGTENKIGRKPGPPATGVST
jgi:glycerol-3-phosphate acyltransferase PlsY